MTRSACAWLIVLAFAAVTSAGIGSLAALQSAGVITAAGEP